MLVSTPSAVSQTVGLEMGARYPQREMAQRIPSQPRLSVRIDGERGRIVVTVIDPDTGGVIRRVPWEEQSHLLRHTGELKGIVIDEMM